MQSSRDTAVSMNSIVAQRDWKRYRRIRYRLDTYAQRGLQVILMLRSNLDAQCASSSKYSAKVFGHQLSKPGRV